jgi:hypothetical protein
MDGTFLDDLRHIPINQQSREENKGEQAPPHNGPFEEE